MSALAKLDRARADLAEARTLEEVKGIRDIAEAARTYAKAAKLGREAQNYAAEISLLASRKAGELLGQLERKQGARTDKLPAGFAGSSEYRQALKDTSTPERTARHWQQLSGVPEADVEKYIATVRKTHSGEITAAGLLREAKKNARRTRPTTIVVGNAKPCGRKIGPFACCSVVQGNCLEVLPQLPTNAVGAVVTDPPYGVSVDEYGGFVHPAEDSEWDGAVPYDLLPEFLRVASGAVVWFGSATKIAEAYATFDEAPHRQLIWAPSFKLGNFSAQGIAYRFQPVYTWRLPKKHDGPVWDVIATPTERGNWWKHSCSKPVALMRDLVGFAPTGAVVLDPFAGSGSTLVAAQSTGRHYLGFESNAEYVAVANARLSGVVPRSDEAVERAA